MKKMHNKILLTLLTVIFTANSVFAAPLTIKTTIIKFSFAMFGVAFFSILLYLGLSLYNKFFVSKYVKDPSFRQDSLKSPKDKDEAINMFISKNRIK